MQHDVPAPGFKMVSGEKGPTEGEWWCQLRTGWVDHHGPWPWNGPQWKHTGSGGDVVAVKRAD